MHTTLSLKRERERERERDFCRAGILGPIAHFFVLLLQQTDCWVLCSWYKNSSLRRRAASKQAKAISMSEGLQFLVAAVE
jgi:hypothetical protein